MKKDFIIVREIDNWLDLREKMLEDLNNCDNELKLNRFLMAVVLSVCPTPNALIKTREKLGIKLNQRDKLEIIKLYKEELQ